MGYSITAETYEKMEANRQEGRLCAGGNRHCATRATRKIVTEGWLSKVGEGDSHKGEMPLCTRHAKSYTPGYHGVNFVVLDVKKF